MEKIKIILAIIILTLNFSNAFAFSPPEGCEADSYIVYKNTLGNVYVQFYKDNVSQCQVNLGSYSVNTVITANELIYENKLFHSIAILFLAIISAFAFVLGLKTI